tara:strand:- start:10182 stop:12725 length:2544 start_codon:yes stop_codon:yes gene_type:complete
MEREEGFKIDSINIETPLPKNIKGKRKESESRYSLKKIDKQTKPKKDEIINLIQANEIEIAKINLLSWLKIYPEDEKIIEMMIFVERELDDKGEVDYWHNLLFKINPNNKFIIEINEYYKIKNDILINLVHKNWQKCVDLCQDLLKMEKDDKFILISMARAKRGLKDYINAIVYWNKLLKQDRLDENEVLEYCNCLYNARKFDEIIKIISVRSDKNYTNKHLELYIKSLFNIKNFDDCIIYSDKLLSLDKESLIAMKFLSKSLMILGHNIRAVKILEKRLKFGIATVEEYENLIETYLRMDEREKVNQVWERILIKSKKNIQNFFIALEVSMKFSWSDRYERLLNNENMKIDGLNFNIEISKIALRNGNISESWKYLKLSERDQEYTLIQKKINKILKITCSDVSEIETNESNIPIIWTSSLVIRELLRRRKEVKLRNKNLRYSIITSTLNRGGAERQVALTAKGIHERGNDCHLAIHREGRDIKSTYQEDLKSISENIEILSNINLDDINNSGYTIIHENLPLLNLLNNTTNDKIKRLIQYFSENKPDLVHAWQDETILTSAVACSLTGVPFMIGSARSLRPDMKTELHIRKKPYLRECLKIIMKYDWTKLTVNSEAGKLSYAQWLKIDENEIKVIHNGTDFVQMEKNIDISSVKREIEEMGITTRDVIVGGVFRLEPGKRPKLWIDVLERLILKNKNIKGLLVGGGKMENTVRKWVEERGLQNQIKILGERVDVGSLLAAMDIFLLTSISEGLPNVIIEAQGFGIPVISTDVGGVSEIIIHNKTGKLTKSEDPMEISELILEIIKNDKYKEMKITSKENARRKFSLENMLDRTERMYNEVISTIN